MSVSASSFSFADAKSNVFQTQQELKKAELRFQAFVIELNKPSLKKKDYKVKL
jgi:hypothetical protein